MKSKISICIFCVIFSISTIFGIYKIITILNKYKTSSDTYNELTQYIEQIKYPKDQTSTNSPLITIDFTSLKSINNDIIGWIYFDNLNINYPIVQGNDNDYYLSHLIDGSYNNSGSIFLDYRNLSNFSNQHSIIYGHNMLDGSMFSQITEYKNQVFFDKHPTYTIITPEKNYTIEIFSGYTTDVYSEAWKLNFSSNEEFSNWLETTKNKSLFKSNITPSVQDKIITLSTCSYEFDNARFVLVGILKEN